MTKQAWEFQIGYVEEWRREHGYQLVQDTDEDDRVELEENVVYINSRQHPETRFYTLLHEVGHVEGRLELGNIGRGIQSDPGCHAQGADFRERRGDVLTGLDVAGEQVGSGICKCLQVPLGLLYHQVNIQWLFCMIFYLDFLGRFFR